MRLIFFESRYVAEREEGDETDADERSSEDGDESDDDKPPREEDEHEESEDEAHTSKNEKQDIGDYRNDKHDLGGDFNENQGANKGIGNVVDNGNEIIFRSRKRGLCFFFKLYSLCFFCTLTLFSAFFTLLYLKFLPYET